MNIGCCCCCCCCFTVHCITVHGISLTCVIFQAWWFRFVSPKNQMNVLDLVFISPGSTVIAFAAGHAPLGLVEWAILRLSAQVPGLWVQARSCTAFSQAFTVNWFRWRLTKYWALGSRQGGDLALVLTFLFFSFKCEVVSIRITWCTQRR